MTYHGWGPQSWLWVLVSLLVGCITSQKHAGVYRGWVCSDKFTCCHTEIEVADQTVYLTQSQYTDTGTAPTSSSTDPTTPGTWQGSHGSASFYVTGMTRPGQIPTAQAGIEPRIFRSRGGRLNHYAKGAVVVSAVLQKHHRLVGPVVRRPTSRAGDAGIDPRLFLIESHH